MTRSSLISRTFGLGLFILGSLGSYGCGGGDMPAKPPETPAEGTTDPNAAAAPTPPPAETAAAPAAPAEPPPAPPPAKLDLPSASAKLKVNTGKALDLELKSDGTVNSGGKPSAKISGMELQDKDGKTQLKVDNDGNITTADGAPYAKFDGDTLTLATGAKWAIGDDGSLQATSEKGAAKSAGKTDGVGSAKRSALLAAAFATWGTKAPQPKGGAKAAADKPAGGDKPAGDKPKGDKKPKK